MPELSYLSTRTWFLIPQRTCATIVNSAKLCDNKLPFQVIDWISMIIDAKFTTIILCSDLCKLIKLIKNAVGSQVSFTRRSPHFHPITWYIFEIVLFCAFVPVMKSP